MKTADDLTDKELRRRARERFATAERLESEYMRALRQLTRQIDSIVRGMAPGGVVSDSIELQRVLQSYAETIRPWARAIAGKMLLRIMRKDENAWAQLGKTMGRHLRKELQGAPTGAMMREFLLTQVTLITSLPLDAAMRVHKLTTEARLSGRRSEDIAKEILRTGMVTESRARLIARTEVARTAAALTMARAVHVGSTHYIWRTCRDMDVRKSHRDMDGAVIPWETAPTLSDGSVTHAGMIYNCRCYAEPILTDE